MDALTFHAIVSFLVGVGVGLLLDDLLRALMDWLARRDRHRE